MNQANQALEVALAAASALPSPLQHQLAERLLIVTEPDTRRVTVLLRRLSAEKHTRLGELMDKNNEGALTRAERLELERLGKEVDQMTLANSKALAHAMRPELFNQAGEPIKSRLRAALKNTSPKRNGSKAKARRK